MNNLNYATLEASKKLHDADKLLIELKKTMPCVIRFGMSSESAEMVKQTNRK